MDGEFIKAAIKKAKTTQEKVARDLGMTRENLNKILSGEVPPAMVAMIQSVGIDLTFVKEYDSKKNYAGPGVMDRLSTLKPKAEQNINEEFEDAGTLIIRKEDLIQVLKTYQVIINQALNDGIIRFEKKKIKTA